MQRFSASDDGAARVHASVGAALPCKYTDKCQCAMKVMPQQAPRPPTLVQTSTRETSLLTMCGLPCLTLC